MRVDRWGNVITDVSGFRAEKKIHKGEFRRQRQPHLSCESLLRKIKSRGFLHRQFSLKIAFHIQLNCKGIFPLSLNQLGNVLLVSHLAWCCYLIVEGYYLTTLVLRQVSSFVSKTTDPGDQSSNAGCQTQTSEMFPVLLVVFWNIFLSDV